MRLRVFGIGLATTCVLAGCSPDEETLRHGVIKIDPRPEPGQGSGVFSGTTRVRLVMRYETCLAEFYQQQPSWQQDGIDGAPVFGTRDLGGEGWADRLCDDPERDQMPCEVLEIRQELALDPQLVVELAVEHDSLEANFLKFGPVPLSELAGCRSAMRVPANPAVGFVGANRSWETKSFGDSVGEPNQGKAIVVRVGPAN